MNFFDFLDRQYTQDRRAFIVYGPARGGKTHFARRLCQKREDLYYLDLLEYSLAHPELPRGRAFTPEALQKLLLDLAVPPQVHAVLVDNPDFLYNTWSDGQKNSFIAWLRTHLRSPGLTRLTFVFFIQEDGVLSSADLKNLTTSRVRSLSEFEAV